MLIPSCDGAYAHLTLDILKHLYSHNDTQCLISRKSHLRDSDVVLATI